MHAGSGSGVRFRGRVCCGSNVGTERGSAGRGIVLCEVVREISAGSAPEIRNQRVHLTLSKLWAQPRGGARGGGWRVGVHVGWEAGGCRAQPKRAARGRRSGTFFLPETFHPTPRTTKFERGRRARGCGCASPRVRAGTAVSVRTRLNRVARTAQRVRASPPHRNPRHRSRILPAARAHILTFRRCSAGIPLLRARARA